MMKKFLLLCVICALLSQSIVLATETSSNFYMLRLATEIRLAHECFAAGDYANAKILLERHIKNTACPPTVLPFLQLSLGTLLIRTNPTEALTYLQQCSENRYKLKEREAALALIQQIQHYFF